MDSIKEIKTLDIDALEWFDKVNGNSYFAARVTLNYSLENQKLIVLPFQYGYGDQYKHEARIQLQELGYIPKDVNSLWQYCDDNKIITRYNKTKALKREVRLFGTDV